MDKTLLLRLYRDMLEIRRFEEVAQRCYAEGLISGFLHLYIGQEGVAVGAISEAEPTDYIVATYREHGHYLARTHDLRGAMAELFGRATGCSKGRGGSMHLFKAESRFLGGHAIVGGHVPLSAGVAFASKYRGEKDVTICFFGDGSANMGAFHEGLCLASLWKLPVVFLCENNLYAMGTPLYKTLAVEDVSTRALGYPMARETVNGDDVMEVREAVRVALRRAREESSPTLIEAKTYRFRGHSISDPAKYRSKEELEFWKQRDPISTLGSRILDLGMATEAMLKDIDAEVRQAVEDAVAFAKASPFPEPDTLYDYVYADGREGEG